MHTTVNQILSVYTYSTDRTTFYNNKKAPHKTHNYCLSYQLNGEYTYTIEENNYRVKTDTVFLIHKDDSYIGHCVQQGNSICIIFQCETDLPSMALPFEDTPVMRNLFYKLLQYHRTQSAATACLAMSTLYEILAHIYTKREQSYLSTDTRKRIGEAHAYLLANFHKHDFQIEDIAKSCNISTKHFRNQFKRLYGSTPAQYLISLRLNTAVNLLSTTDLPIKEIVSVSGFSDVYYFSKLFKKKFLCTPNHFRKQRAEAPHIYIPEQKKEELPCD